MHLRPVQQAIRIAASGSDPVQKVSDEVSGRFLKDLFRAAPQQRRCTDITPVFRQGGLSTPHPAAALLQVGGQLAPQATAVRDSKAPDGPMLMFSNASWNGFLTAVRHQQLDS